MHNQSQWSTYLMVYSIHKFVNTHTDINIFGEGIKSASEITHTEYNGNRKLYKWYPSVEAFLPCIWAKIDTTFIYGKLAHCCLVMPCHDANLCQHWFGQCFIAWWHQAITWTIVDFPLMRFCGIYRRALPTKAQATTLYDKLEKLYI